MGTVDFCGSDRRVYALVCFGGPSAGSAAEKSSFPVLVAEHRSRRDASFYVCPFTADTYTHTLPFYSYLHDEIRGATKR